MNSNQGSERSILDQMKAIQCKNPDHINYSWMFGKLHLVFLGFVVPAYDPHNISKRLELEIDLMSNPQRPLIEIVEPLNVFHPNIDPNQKVQQYNTPNFINEWNRHNRDIHWLIIHLWEVFTLQYVDDGLDAVKNKAALRWFVNDQKREPWFKQKLVIPGSLHFSIVEQRPGKINVEKSAERERSVRGHDEQSLSQLNPRFEEDRNNEALPPEQPIKAAVSSSIQSATTSSSQNTRFEIGEGPSTDKVFRLLGTRPFTPPERPLPNPYQVNDPYERNLLIFIPTILWDRIIEHALGDRKNERIGFLYGHVYTDSSSNFTWLDINEVKPAKTSASSMSKVEVGMDEMARLQNEIDQQFPGETLKLGWYHTHPGHRIFMSSTDKNNQKNSYRSSWQIALVIDPINRHFGFFAGPYCRPVPFENIIIEPDSSILVSQKLQYRFLDYSDNQPNKKPSTIPDPHPKDPIPPKDSSDYSPFRLLALGILILLSLVIMVFTFFNVFRRNDNSPAFQSIIGNVNNALKNSKLSYEECAVYQKILSDAIEAESKGPFIALRIKNDLNQRCQLLALTQNDNQFESEQLIEPTLVPIETLKPTWKPTRTSQLSVTPTFNLNDAPKEPSFWEFPPNR
jgi:proteasome lid subunit RPN8/RPN11